MRFLCLHGRGTNAKPAHEIFEMQTARIRKALGREHEYVFINGRVETEPYPGAERLSAEVFGHTAIGNVKQHAELCDELVEFVKAEGPFDGVMGFSEGGGVAGLILLLLQDLLVEEKHHYFAGIKCAVFFSSAVPFDVGLVRQKGVVRWLDPAVDGVVVRMPTAHIWCESSGLEVSGTWAKMCEERTREVYKHNLGHMIPGSHSEEGLKETVRVIERTIEKAKLREAWP